MLVGRESELALVADGMAANRLVAVVGEAGVGKTALLREAAAATERTLHETGGLATLSWLPYLPIRRVLGRSIDEGDKAYVAAEVEGAVGPGVLLLDDLHWCDGATRALLPLLRGRVTILTALRKGDPGTEPALAELNALGTKILELPPLDEDDAQELARRVRPELSPAVVEQLVRQAGGNPLLVEELAAAGGPTESVRLALAARLRLLSPRGRDAMSRLALLGRPAPSELLGDGADELLAVGLATAEGEIVRVRHPLLAETAVGELCEDERRRLHAELAAALADPGEAARHHAAAGERQAALTKALVATQRATLPGEQAAHLAIAAECAEGPEADDIRLQAAAALVVGEEATAAERILQDVDLTDPERRAKVRLLQMQARWITRDLDGCRTAIEDAVAAATGTGCEIEVRVLAEAARTDCLQLGEYERAIERADLALELGRGNARLEPRLFFVAGANRMQAHRDESEWRPYYEASIAAARAAGDYDTELRAAEMLAYGTIMFGRPVQARAVAEEAARHARELKLTGRERRLQIWMCGADWHGGFPRRCAELAERLARETLERGDAEFLLLYRAQSLADIGRCDEACRLLRAAGADAVPDLEGLGEVLWGLSDAEWLAGRPRAALEAADEFLARFGSAGRGSFVCVNRAWACVELGVDPGPASDPPGVPLGEGVAPETGALAHLAHGDARAAAELFHKAAGLWDGRHVRGRVRCLWAAGEAFRRSGELETAREVLTEGEQVAEERGFEPLLRRIRRSLRLAGDRRAAVRTRDERGLTGRELEVLDLVAEGLSNEAIARRLGIGRPTVARIVASASRKLGARSRVQAAALARRQ